MFVLKIMKAMEIFKVNWNAENIVQNHFGCNSQRKMCKALQLMK